MDGEFGGSGDFCWGPFAVGLFDCGADLSSDSPEYFVKCSGRVGAGVCLLESGHLGYDLSPFHCRSDDSCRIDLVSLNRISKIAPRGGRMGRMIYLAYHAGHADLVHPVFAFG